MSKRTVSIDTELYEVIGKAARRARDQGIRPVVLGHDGGATTGWCLFDGETSLSGDGPPAFAARACLGAIALLGTPTLYVREHPFTVARKNVRDDEAQDDSRHATPLTLYRMGQSAGRFEGVIDEAIERAVLWEPFPGSWRAVLGLNRKATPGQSARDATGEAVWLWAKATSRKPLLTNGGRKMLDEAMAIGMARAGHAIMLAAEQSG